MKILAVIPARYASTRFPAKPLADLNGKPMIQWVYEGVQNSGLFSKVVIATDHREIETTVKGFGGEVSMTSPTHPSGTDRCNEVLASENANYDYIVNIQGDEPLISHEQLAELIYCLDGKVEIASQYRILKHLEEIENPAQVKLVLDDYNNALYFSRAAIPYIRGIEKAEWTKNHDYKGHIGLYAFRSDILEKIALLKPSKLEQLESLEQLRWLEAGYAIKMVETKHRSIGVDTPEDLEKVKAALLQK